MYGRGRGRGKAVAPPSVANAALFSTPATPLPSTSVEPPPLFPRTSMPEPIDPTEADIPAIQFYEELSRYMHTSPYYLASKSSKEQKIDRYSDKYLAHLQTSDRKGKVYAINTDLSFFPEELHSAYNVEKAQKLSRAPIIKHATFDETIAKLKDLEKNDKDEDGLEGVDAEDREENDEDGDEGTVYEEDELEDETDYNLNYFDNGEDYGGEYDDGDEGPVY